MNLRVFAVALLSTSLFAQGGSVTLTIQNPTQYVFASNLGASFSCEMTNTGTMTDTLSAYGNFQAVPSYLYPDPTNIVLLPGQSFQFDLVAYYSSDIPPGENFQADIYAYSLAGGNSAASANLVFLHPAPSLDIWQTAPLAPVELQSYGTFAFKRYHLLISPEPCPLGPGTGPLLGLCSTNVEILIAQFNAPLGTLPFHFTGLEIVDPAIRYLGAYAVPPGITVDCLLLYPNLGPNAVQMPWLPSPVQRYTTM